MHVSEGKGEGGFIETWLGIGLGLTLGVGFGYGYDESDN